ncbi:hypothetical protein NCAS_0C05340 [Naumovozyma castellii]|uniref:CUE domain-containing protein n=1 Tax=Naumovozyma castellii TaxID=27288 RepID=G0VDG2_NAUCA|nr:hypothetical protein NCAS_0C05340 [Naumovozyma castellii CBS 4309]CCC69524.1 hypothetical protein NCAS_0C05340 [Naumovozyma castellii CBS 4309]
MGLFKKHQKAKRQEGKTNKKIKKKENTSSMLNHENPFSALESNDEDVNTDLTEEETLISEEEEGKEESNTPVSLSGENREETTAKTTMSNHERRSVSGVILISQKKSATEGPVTNSKKELPELVQDSKQVIITESSKNQTKLETPSLREVLNINTLDDNSKFDTKGEAPSSNKETKDESSKNNFKLEITSLDHGSKNGRIVENSNNEPNERTPFLKQTLNINPVDDVLNFDSKKESSPSNSSLDTAIVIDETTGLKKEVSATFPKICSLTLAELSEILDTHSNIPELAKAFPSVDINVIKSLLFASEGEVLPAFHALLFLTNQQNLETITITQVLPKKNILSELFDQKFSELRAMKKEAERYSDDIENVNVCGKTESSDVIVGVSNGEMSNCPIKMSDLAKEVGEADSDTKSQQSSLTLNKANTSVAPHSVLTNKEPKKPNQVSYKEWLVKRRNEMGTPNNPTQRDNNRTKENPQRSPRDSKGNNTLEKGVEQLKENNINPDIKEEKGDNSEAPIPQDRESDEGQKGELHVSENNLAKKASQAIAIVSKVIGTPTISSSIGKSLHDQVNSTSSSSVFSAKT